MAQVAKAIKDFLDGIKESKKQAGNSSALSAGVSLRDYFAGMALRGLMERHDIKRLHGCKGRERSLHNS